MMGLFLRNKMSGTDSHRRNIDSS
uniref:Uncharacterized protein n=1 Tax=Arundo donax TaxID=35708 RepID=A0A0A9AK73_ARUDO